MNELRTRPSRFAIEKYLSGTANADERAHVEASPWAMEEVQAAKQEEAEFLAAHPSPDSLLRHRPRRWMFPLAATASLAAASLAVFVLTAEPPQPPSERVKGAPAAWLDVVRDGVRTPWQDAKLQPGDALSIRYTSSVTQLAVFLIEESGGVQVLSAEDGRSRRIRIGQDITLDQAFVLDDYEGKQLLIALFDDEAFEVAPVRQALARTLAEGGGLDDARRSVEGFGHAVSFSLERRP